MNSLAQSITRWRESKGFKTPSGIFNEEDRTRMNEKLMLCVTELAEACEAVRHADYEGFCEELADTMIRILDICGACHIDIEDEIGRKMMKNRARQMLHGKKC